MRCLEANLQNRRSKGAYAYQVPSEAHEPPQEDAGPEEEAQGVREPRTNGEKED